MRRSPGAILSASALAAALALTGCGAGAGAELSGTPATSAASSDAGVDAGTSTTETTTADSTLFTDGASHTVSVTWNEDDYAAMIAAYEADGSKDWIAADITIDGTTVSNVGVRLKGNSTLRSLSGSGNGAGGGMGGNAASSGISSDVPESLPLLIRFDKYVDGQTYQGLGEVSLRPGSPVLNEALALALTGASGQATQRYAYTTYSVNGSPTQTRLLVENPDEDYADSLFDTPGVLYKADADSSFTYQGDDLATYEDQFKQLNNGESETVQPIVDFLKWLSEATDEEFDAGLAERVDVESFARYTATMNLLVNGDDMAGPGQNYYLWYSLDTRKISVISWDLNLAMTGDATASPEAQLSIGGGGGGAGGGGGGGGAGGGGGGGGAGGGMQPPGSDDGGRAPFAGAAADAGGAADADGTAAADGAGPGEAAPGGAGPGEAATGTWDAAAGTGAGGGGGRGGNELKERFLASDAFQSVYDAAYADLYAQLYASGTAASLLDSIAAVVPLSDGLTAEELAGETQTLRTFIQERTDALKGQV
ncbi:Spore coat protein CotH [Pseudarthrobacter chlorophenolicus A6]|uniref:Spore coat protein CotH n=1 Tax=Pseudarthrobacter chlorophenolicus (strain ATCC 700700 / DSM 12829 / CIP 107037 / JCM 12360 / KCTC 9906 / NCIMB 13794 / A6) TaxID=452863 RepID=B8HHA9_PSECP|nr:CotH kinase family protein [Pseudarthrobacter chlorophenolicus]ACL41400.1 Spore coat protein CotH [Pseudarthrobacter chlorophenolicus A6]SDQ64807.1 Spore coat protein CotH [Pseudarthrobacter chlorophenolicus]